MRYFYTRLPGRVTLDQIETVNEYEIPSLDDERIKPGTIQPFTRYTGWLEMTEVPDEFTPVGALADVPITADTPLPLDEPTPEE